MKQMLAVALIVVASLFILSTPNVMAQGETGDCYGNFDCDQDVDAIDVANFLSSFGRSPFFNPCPLCQDSLCPCSSTVPKTGQTTSYATGDDGDLQKGLIWPNPRFTDNGDGTVTDNLTKLIWLQDANCFGTRTWNNALSDSNSLADPACGLSDGSIAGDWRLANKRELISITTDGYSNPAVPDTAGTGQCSEGDPFTNSPSGNYWSSTTYANNTTYGWNVNLSGGGVYVEPKTTQYYVWPVRDRLFCVAGWTRQCGTDVGECEYGLQTCGSDDTWGECVGAVGPTLEDCEDGVDNDCDSLTDVDDPECPLECDGQDCRFIFGPDACCCDVFDDGTMLMCEPDAFMCEMNWSPGAHCTGQEPQL